MGQDTLVLEKEHGGMGMVDISSYFKARQIKWMHRISNETNENWSMISKYYFERVGKEFGDNNFLFKCTDIRNIDLKGMPIFYVQCLESWAELGQRNQSTENTTDNILEQNLFGNHRILFRAQPILAKSGILQIKDIWDIN